MRTFFLVLIFIGASAFAWVSVAHATVFGTVRGVVHDPQHLPVAGAAVELKSTTSDYFVSSVTGANGEFSFPAIALGDYTVKVTANGFSPQTQSITLASDTSSVLHFMLSIATPTASATIKTQVGTSPLETVTPTTLLNRADIAATPGATITNSLAMITDYTPGSYMTHDMLHMRGGHQTTWLIDGIPIPDTNIGTSLGPRVDPKDIDYVEVLRGSYNAQYGDRTYGEFNVLPKSGFDMNSEAEIVATVGSFYQTDDQIGFGSHTQRFAYYASVNGNRTNLGLETPVSQVHHDAANGTGGFTSLLYNLNSKNQLRFDAQYRRDFYQIPYDRDPNDFENSQFQTSGLRDHELETDGYTLFSWVHTFNANAALTVSPFYHYNSSGYHSLSTDQPVATTAVFSPTYGGGQATLNFHLPRNDAQAGVYACGANQNETFGILSNDHENPGSVNDHESVRGSEEAIYASDKLNITSWLTLLGGVRSTHFSGGVVENSTVPRIGATLQIPRVNWVFRAFWGKYYQPPPFVSISGPLLQFIQPGCNAATQNCCADPGASCFLPLHGERDEEHQFGVTIPVRGWTLDVDNFTTRGVNFLDHNNIGESSVFIPVTFAQSRINGTEVTLRSPRLWRRGNVHLAYSNQMAEQQGAETGGLVEGTAPCPTWCALDHDQRNTLNVGGNVNLPWQAAYAMNVYYGSGFSNGSAGLDGSPFQDPYLPGHAQIDMTLMKNFGERFSASVTVLNVADRHLLTDNSLTFGGFHYNNPREVYAQVRWHFHY